MPRSKQRSESKTLIAAEAPREQLLGDEWFKALQPDHCMFCQSMDWEPGWGPLTFIRCSGCAVKAFHVGCLQKSGLAVTQDIIEDDADVFCSQECEKITQSWNDKLGKKLKVKGEASEYSLEVIKYNPKDKGSVQAVSQAIRIFRSCFSKLVMDNGKDLIEMVCRSYESPAVTSAQPQGSTAVGGDMSKKAGASEDDNPASQDEDEPDIFSFGQFRLLSLRKGPAVVSVATLRVFGSHFAEMPFIATREGYRREGNCRRMVKAVDELLHSMGVRYLVLPSILSVLRMWINKFHFSELSAEEDKALLECEIVQMEAETTKLVKRRVGLPIPVPTANKPSTSLGVGTAAAFRPQRSSSITQKSNATSTGRTASKHTRGRKPSTGKKAKSSHSCDDSDSSSSSSEDESGSEYSGTRSDSSESAGSGLEPEHKMSDSQQDSDEVTSPMSQKQPAKKGRGPATGIVRAPLGAPRKIWPSPSQAATTDSILANSQVNAKATAPAAGPAAARPMTQTTQASESDKTVAAVETNAVPQTGKPPVASRKRPAGPSEAGRNLKQPRMTGAQQGKQGALRQVCSTRSQQLAKQVKAAAAARRAAAQDAMLAVTLAESVAHALMGRDALQAQLDAMQTYIAHLEQTLLKHGTSIEQFASNRPASLPPLVNLLQLPAPVVDRTEVQTTPEGAQQDYSKKTDHLTSALSQADINCTQSVTPQCSGMFPLHNPNLYPTQYLHNMSAAERAVAMYATAVLQAGIQAPSTPGIHTQHLPKTSGAMTRVAGTTDVAMQTTTNQAMEIDIDSYVAPDQCVDVTADNCCMQGRLDVAATATDVQDDPAKVNRALDNTHSSCSDHLLDADDVPSARLLVSESAATKNVQSIAPVNPIVTANKSSLLCTTTAGQSPPGHTDLDEHDTCMSPTDVCIRPMTTHSKANTVETTAIATPRLDLDAIVEEDLLHGWKHTASDTQQTPFTPRAIKVIITTPVQSKGCTVATLPMVQDTASEKAPNSASAEQWSTQLPGLLGTATEPQCEGASPRTALPPLPPTPAMPATAVIGNTDESNQTSPDFASPLTMRSFHAHCLDRLVPQVIHSWLESPSPSIGAVNKASCHANQSPQPLQPIDDNTRPRSKAWQRNSLVTAVFGVSLDGGTGGSSGSSDDQGDIDVPPASNARDDGAVQGHMRKVMQIVHSQNQSQQDGHDNTALCEEEQALQTASKFCSWNQYP